MNYETISLEKGMYKTGKSFSTLLEELDPSENYRGTFLEGTDAYMRQLKRFGINTNGRHSDCIEKFFQSSDASVLFPEYISRTVTAGMEKNNILPEITASTTVIDALDYRSIRSLPAEDDLELKTVDEGGDLEETEITVDSELVNLKKRGRLLSVSYEVLRFQKLDVFSVMLRQIGAYMAKTQLQDAIDTIIGSEDDGKYGITKTNVKKAGELTYSDLVSFWNRFDPFNMDVILASPDVMEKILNLGIFSDSNAGLNFHATGKMITPFGAKLFKTNCLDSGTLIGLDSSCALEYIQAGGVLTEFDKLIDSQIERAAISVISGFSRLHDNAGKMLVV